MTFSELLINHWNFNIPAFIIIAALVIFHFVTNGNRFTKKSFIFFSGIVLFFLLTFSPINFLGHYYLFSAHMIQHIILLLIIPPLLLTGTNEDFLMKIIENPKFKKFASFLFYPLTAWMIGVGSMWIWHIPLLFMGMMQSQVVHVIEIISLLIAGLIFAWPVFAPVNFRKLEPLQSALFLFTACVGCTVLGIFITFAPAGFYSSYMIGSNPSILNLLQFNMGITPEVDQQAAGLIMWVPACLIYLTIIMIIMAKWYSKPAEERENESYSNHLDLS